ncbi:phosphonate transport system substrate-binding protein [Bradyrhizobium sp. USDA 4369]
MKQMSLPSNAPAETRGHSGADNPHDAIRFVPVRQSCSKRTAISRRAVHLGLLATAGSLLTARARAASSREPIRFAVGPTLPTPDDSRRAWDPLFKKIAEKLGRPYTLAATTDWAGTAVALASGQVDISFVGPWGYVLAKREGGAIPLAMLKLDGLTYYHAIVVARPGLSITKWPEDAKGLRISFADMASTSGWLIPAYWFKQRGIDPKSYFQYRDGATHAANETAVANGQVDVATDNDRNRQLMIEKGILKPEASNIVWRSDPIPNSLIAARADLDPSIVDTVRQLLLDLSEEQAKALMPEHYTGFAPTKDSDFALIEEAGVALGLLKRP